MKEYLSTVSDVLKQHGTSEKGLTTEEAQKRFAKSGPNRLAEGKKTPVILRFLKELTDPMTIILIVAAIVSAITAV